MTATALHHLNVCSTPDRLEATREFYEKYLGLETGPRPPFRDDGYWMYHDGHPWVHISLRRNMTGETGQTGFGHIAFYGEDYRGLKKRLEQNGMQFEERPTPDDRLMQVFFSDPNGVMVEIVYPIEIAREAAREAGDALAVRA